MHVVHLSRTLPPPALPLRVLKAAVSGQSAKWQGCPRAADVRTSNKAAVSGPSAKWQGAQDKQRVQVTPAADHPLEGNRQPGVSKAHGENVALSDDKQTPAVKPPPSYWEPEPRSTPHDSTIGLPADQGVF